MSTESETTTATAPKRATRKPTAKQPGAKPATKPAVKKPATKQVRKKGTVGIKDIAAKLDRDEKSVRASIRRILGGPQVGKGGRYSWSSWDDKQLKKLMADLTKTDAK